MVTNPNSKTQNPTKPYTKILGVDSSSTGVAWSLIDNGELKESGKIKLTGKKEIVDKLALIYDEWTKLLDSFEPDFVIVEKSIFVKNPATARTLSYVVGTLLAISAGKGIDSLDIEPSTWKAFYGYKNVSAQQKKNAEEKLGRLPAKKFCEALRKSQTRNSIIYHTGWELPEDDHDICDSAGIALYGWSLSHDVKIEKSNSIIYTPEQRDIIGLGG